jgi:1-phosphatidylinositol-3-phosphate 5-kinase
MSEGINFPLYIRSLYGCQSWDSSGGKSNSTFSKSHNEVLVVKIINDKEFVEFQKFALAYLNYMKSKRDSHGRSYLAKIYGIYEATIRNKVYKFVVMQNIFIGVNPPMKVYDLKGSEVNRLAAPTAKAYTGLDTNFIFDKEGRPYILETAVYDRTIRTFEEDAAFLRDASVIDYSLLVIESERVLRLGIIDFMRPYHLIEKIENKYKEMMSGKDPTVIEPTKYAERFVAALKRYFIKVPSAD